MASVQIASPVISENIRTSLSEDYLSGTTLSVLSSVGFADTNYIVIGEPGLENTEITNLTASPPDNTSLTVAALKFSHPKGTPIYYTSWDKYSLEYRISSGAWNVYAGMPLSLTYDDFFTEYRDFTALSTYQWRYRYYSTEKSAYSDYSDIISATGWERRSVGYMVREIRKIVNDLDSKTVSDTEIIRFLNAAQDKIYTLYDRWWFLLKTGTAISTATGDKDYPLPTDFGRMHSVSFRYVNGASDITYNLKYLPISSFDAISKDNNAQDSDDMKYYSIYPGDIISPIGYLYVYPVPLTASLNITPRYYKTFSDLENYSDITEVPIPDTLENYALAQILRIRKEDDKANAYDTMFREQIQLLKLMQRKNASPMRSLWVYQGPHAESRLFGNRDTYSEADLENNW